MTDETTRASGPRGPSERRVPEGDDRERLICPDCGFVAYENPKIVVGSVVHAGEQVLLCRRAIPPRTGFWTLPAGFLETGETAAEGAAREAWEEARARIGIEAVLALYDLPRISQMQVIYRASLLDPAIAPGPESQEVALFTWDEIPWDDIAFPTVHWALAHYRERIGLDRFPPFGNPPGESSDLR